MIIDDVEPPCFKDRTQNTEDVPGVNSCWVPQPDERGRRIIEIRAKLVSLQGIVDPGTILRLYEADLEDIELLAFLEEQIKEMNDNGKKDNG